MSDYAVCPECKKDYPAGAKYCAACGSPLIDLSAKARQRLAAWRNRPREFQFLEGLASIIVFVGVVEVILGWVLPALVIDWLPRLVSTLFPKPARQVALYQYLPSVLIFVKLNLDGLLTIGLGEFVKVQIRQNDHLQEISTLLRWFAKTALNNE